MAPGETSQAKTAPQPLYLVQRFVNSVDLESGEDELTSPDALRDWFAERGLMDAAAPVSAADLERALDVREGLRAVLLQNNGLPLDQEAVERLDRAVGRAAVRVRFAPGRDPELVAGCEGVDGAIARLMAIVAAAVEHGRWERLKACPRDECEWVFYDKSKNRSGRWCSMESCGNIEKAKAFRARHRGQGVRPEV
jgi:predicted RNA-binding Zn ribbon-like protein